MQKELTQFLGNLILNIRGNYQNIKSASFKNKYLNFPIISAFIWVMSILCFCYSISLKYNDMSNNQ